MSGFRLTNLKLDIGVQNIQICFKRINPDIQFFYFQRFLDYQNDLYIQILIDQTEPEIAFPYINNKPVFSCQD